MNPAIEAVRYMRWLAGRLDQGGQPKIAAATYRIAGDLEQYETARTALHEPGSCRSCGGNLVNAHTGRPRVYCRECRPPETRRKLQTQEG